MIIYADVLFLNNTLMTYAIIWAVSSILDYKTKWWRLLIAALTGTIYSFLFLYISMIGFTGLLNIFIHLSLNIITGLLMIFITFGKISRTKIIKALIYLYLVSFLVIGTIYSIYNIYGIEILQNVLSYGVLLGLVIIIIIAKLGWVFLKKHISPDNFHIPLTILINDKKIKITGLLDTGNKLTDPLTGVPVIIVEAKTILSLPSSCENIMDLVTKIENHDLAARFRVLPFNDLGAKHGMLLGLRPDQVKIKYNNQEYKTTKVIIGLTEKKLDYNQDYQALINPDLIKI